MAAYVDGFVMPLPKSNLDRYRDIATTAGELWIEHGALDYKECVAEDVNAGEGHLLSPQRQAGGRRDGDLRLDHV